MSTRALFLAAALALSACASEPAPKRFADVDLGMGAERDVVVDGVRLRVHEGGVPGAPTVVLLHCFGLHMKVWRDLLPHLEDRFHVVAYDAIGHGKSAMPARRSTLALHARLAVGLLDALGIERASLVGNSMGGGVALHAALAAPERVWALVLVDGVGLRDAQWFVPLWPFASGDDVASGAPWTWRTAMALAHEKPSPLVDEILDDVLATRGDEGARRNARAMHTVVADIFRTDLSARLADVRAPTLVVHGRHDRLVSVDHAERLAAGIRGARLHVFEDLGHLPEAEDPAQVASVVVPFLAASLAAGAR